MKVLGKLGVSGEQIRSEIERQVTRGDAKLGQDMQLTPRAKRVIDLAYEEAKRIGNDFIGTEHLLLGFIREADGMAGRVLAKLLRETDGLAGRVLAELGVELEAVREEVRRHQEANAAAPASEQSGVLRDNYLEDLRRRAGQPGERGAKGYLAAIYEPGTTCRNECTEEAQRLNEQYLSTEHLLLGLINEPDNVASRILNRMGVSLEKIRSEIERQVTPGDGVSEGEMHLTPRSKRVVDLAYDEARQINNKFIGTEHLLLALIREGEGLAARVLAKLGAGLDAARREVLALQDNNRGASAERSHRPGRDVPAGGRWADHRARRAADVKGGIGLAEPVAGDAGRRFGAADRGRAERRGVAEGA